MNYILSFKILFTFFVKTNKKAMAAIQPPFTTINYN
jgi:hypothetical protein